MTTERNALRLLTLVLCVAALPLPAFCQAGKYETAWPKDLREYWRQKLLAPPASRDPTAVEKQVPPPPLQRQLILEQVGIWGGGALIGEEHKGDHIGWTNVTFEAIAPAIRLGALRARNAGDGSLTGMRDWPYVTGAERGYTAVDEPVFAELPDWFLDAVQKEVRKLSLSGNRQAAAIGKKDKAGAAARQAAWRADDTPGDAFVWAGPAVKDSVASYRATNDGMAVRIAMPAERAAEIYALAGQRGLPLSLRLVRDDQPVYPHTPVIIVGSTAIPVWLAGPDGLVAATLTAFSAGGDVCDGSLWMEFAYKGSASPPVWAVLGFSDPTLAGGVTVRRLPKRPVPERESYLEAQRSEIELRWPKDRLPALRIAARRFEWARSEYEEDEKGNVVEKDRTVLGSAWGTQVFTRMPAGLAVVNGEPSELVLSAAGTPRCPPP